jgi:hypothetical protein
MVQPLEFFKTAWSKPSTWHLSPNLLAAINFFNHVSLWVGTMIVTTEKVRERAKIMNRCVKIAQVLPSPPTNLAPLPGYELD